MVTSKSHEESIGFCQAQGQGQGQSQSQKSKLKPEVGVVMAWPTHRTTFFEMKTAN